MRALEDVERAIARRASYAEVTAALDACAALPGADEVVQAIESWRVTAALHYERPESECEAALIRYLDVTPALDRRASKILAVCADHPALAGRYLPALIDELEASPRDDTISAILTTARHLQGRLGFV